MLIQQILFISFFLGIFAVHQDNQECFELGECRQSLHIDGEAQPDEYACLDFCNANSECSWMTYFPSTQYCQLYKNCPLLDTEYCADCLSSQSDCVPDDPVCFVHGECDGVVHHTEPSSSAEECLQLCSSTFSCRWFTFETTTSECIILTSCPAIDESCETCITGERRCINLPSSTTLSSTTTETITTTSAGKEYVAFLVGGNDKLNQAEVYSPEGKCQFDISPVPVQEEFFTPILANIDENILACPSLSDNTPDCWQYNMKENTWSVITSPKYRHNQYPGVVYNDKIFIIDDSTPEVYDPRNNSWSSWPMPLQPTGPGSCLIVWRDSIIAFGGITTQRIVQQFNLTLSAWSVLDENLSPFILNSASCTLLPTNQVLLLGSYIPGFQGAVLYDIVNNLWEQLADVKYNRIGATFVNLNGRIFLIGGGHPSTIIDVVEEFHYESNTWTEVEASPINQQMFSSALTLPAEMFAHLPGGCEGIE